jgi:methionyl-tRNA synthetase
MWIIENESKELMSNTFMCYEKEELEDLQKLCDKFNENNKKTTYKIIEIKSKFFCESCKEFLYEKYIGEECVCGAVRCEFCTNSDICICD